MHKILKPQFAPLVVAPLSNDGDLGCLPTLDISQQCDLLELRLDGLFQNLEAIAPAIANLSCPILATARHPDEGGENNLSVAQRSELLARFTPLVSWMDVELRSITELSPVIEAARASGVGIIISFHDFESCPPIEILREKVATALEAHADIVKLAVRMETNAELFAVAQLIEEFPEAQLSLMGMGPLGKLSRLVLAKAGSVLNYGYLDQPNAPGQWPSAQLKSLIAEL